MSVLQGGRKRRRPSRLIPLLLLLVPVVIAAIVWVSRHGGPLHATRAPAASVTPPVAAPSPSRERPDRASAALLQGTDAFRARLRHPPRAGLVFDMRSGEVLWRRAPLRVRPIASLTKIMTALVVVEHTRPDDEVRITRDALRYQGSGVGLLPRGRRVRVESLLYGLLLPSGNDAANALADYVGGSRRDFVRLMNERARQLGLRCTHFASPSGLARRDRSCVADLAILSRVAMRRARIARIVRRERAVIRFPIKGGHLWLYNTNPLLRLRYPGTIGLKTGDTVAAGHCLVAVVRRGGRTLGVVLLHSPDTARQAESLLRRAFRSL